MDCARTWPQSRQSRTEREALRLMASADGAPGNGVPERALRDLLAKLAEDRFNLGSVDISP
jgi:hypothetical protein